MGEYEYRQQWQKDHTVLVPLRLNRNTDGDIVSAIENARSKQGEIKRLVRLGLAYELGLLKTERPETVIEDSTELSVTSGTEQEG